MAYDKNIGHIGWVDLTVPNAKEICEFYQKVVGWTAPEEQMIDGDYCIIPKESDEIIAGVCHARGTNANIPPQWLIYINIEDMDKSVEAAEANGGKIIDGPRNMGGGRFAVLQDPAGAISALFQTLPSKK